MIVSVDEIIHAVRSFMEAVVALGALIIFIQNWRQSRRIKAVMTEVKEVHKLANSMKDELVTEVRQSATKNGLTAGIAVGIEKGMELGAQAPQPTEPKA